MTAHVRSKASQTPGFPTVGDEVFAFRIRRELGQGAFAQVFLAEQADLAGRSVVLKCTTIEGSEPQTLAQLQHTNIVPIYSVHEDRQVGLRAVCMPYFGGASLSQVLGRLWAKTRQPTQGRELVEALEGLQEGSGAKEEGGRAAGMAVPAVPSGGNAGPTPRDLLSRLDYPRAVAWIVAKLADGLHHAHLRGVFHRDIKPANILLSADGQPMLLDFNVSGGEQGNQAKAAVLGGTVAYMAPEHLRALLGGARSPANAVDHRADVYSMGIVLYEALTNHSPFTQKGSYSVLPVLLELIAMERTRVMPSARGRRSDIPWSLESIIRKCLAPDPARRYQQASHLAADLRHFLEDQPLRFAPELSRAEGARKWIRRHPRLTSSGTVALVAAALLAVGAGSLLGIRRHLEAAQMELDVAHAQTRKRAFEEETQRARCLVNTTLDLRDHMQEGQQACRRALSQYEVLDREDWQDQPHWRRLESADRRHLAEDARELLSLLAWSLAKAPSADHDSLRRAVALLDKADAIRDLPPSRALYEDRGHYLERLGDAAGARSALEAARRTEAVGGRDRYLLATSFARRGRHAEAIAEIDQSLEQSPRHYWSFFLRGVTYQETGKHLLAASDFGTCIGLWPEFALGYFNRAYCLDQAGFKVEAIRDYTAALKRDPSLVPAHMNRGMAYLESKRFEEALADLDRVLALGRDDASLHAGRGIALEGLNKPGEADAAFRTAFAKVDEEPESVGNRIRWVYGFAVSARRPDAALAAFEGVLKREPAHPQALYGRAMILSQRGREVDAVADLDRAIAASPDFLQARRCRAVLRARRGELEAAAGEINACLTKEPNSGAALYAAACVSAWVAKKSPDALAASQAKSQALRLLEKAFDLGYGRDKAAEDPDLEVLRDHPWLKRLLQKAPPPPAAP